MSDNPPFRTPSYRPSRPTGMDPATRRLAIVAAGLIAALMALFGAWSVLSGPSRHGVPVIAPPAGPLRQPPPNASGTQVVGAHQPIFGNGGAGGAPKGGVMPGPETPDLQALRAPRTTAPVAAPADVAARAPAATSSAPLAPGASPLPSPPAFRPAPRAVPQPAATQAATGRATARRVPPGAITVQLAALPTQADARREWAALRRRHPGLLGHRHLLLARARVNGREWFRVRTSGFASRHAALRFCARLRASGAACDVPLP